MEKKKYVVPNVVVVDLKHQAPLICTSPDPDPDSGGDVTYIPNMDNSNTVITI